LRINVDLSNEATFDKKDRLHYAGGSEYTCRSVDKFRNFLPTIVSTVNVYSTFHIAICWVTSHRRFITSPHVRGAKYCDERLYVCVVSVYLSVLEDISQTTPVRVIFTNFLCMLLMAVARSSPNVVAISYVLPVLWMTCFFL